LKGVQKKVYTKLNQNDYKYYYLEPLAEFLHHRSRSHNSEPIHARINEGKHTKSVQTWRLINHVG
jgi:hypothetical protein